MINVVKAFNGMTVAAGQAAKVGAHTAGHILYKNAPTICMAGGVGLMVAGAGLAVKITYDGEPQKLWNGFKEIDASAQKTLKEGEEKHKDMSELRMARAQALGGTVGAIIHCYLPAIACGLGGIALIVLAHKMQLKRIAALAGTVATIGAEYADYRSRVKKELGEDKERAIYLNDKNAKLKTFESEDGEKDTALSTVNPNLNSMSRLFDETCPDWNKSATRNLFFLRGAEKSIQAKVDCYGVYTVNEAYRNELGLKPTNTGAVMCWTAGDKVDIGIAEEFEKCIDNRPMNASDTNDAGSYNFWITPNAMRTIYDVDLQKEAMNAGDGTDAEPLDNDFDAALAEA